MVFCLLTGICLFGGCVVSGKYASDYRLENIEGKNGKIVTKPVYRGDLFSFSKTEDEVKKVKVIFAVSTLVEWILFFVSIILNTRAGRAMYVSLPFLALAFPLLGQSDGVWTLLTAKDKVIRSVKDKITEKMVTWIFLVFFFSICSFIGHLVFWVRNGEGVMDVVFLILTLLILAASWNLFLKRKDLEMKKTGTTVLPEKD